MCCEFICSRPVDPAQVAGRIFLPQHERLVTIDGNAVHADRHNARHAGKAATRLVNKTEANSFEQFD